MYHRQTIKENMDMSVDIAVVDTAQRCRGVRKAQHQLRRNASLFNAIGVQSIRPYASFDTHIAISKNDKRQMAYALNMAFLAFLT